MIPAGMTRQHTVNGYGQNTEDAAKAYALMGLSAQLAARYGYNEKSLSVRQLMDGKFSYYEKSGSN